MVAHVWKLFAKNLLTLLLNESVQEMRHSFIFLGMPNASLVLRLWKSQFIPLEPSFRTVWHERLTSSPERSLERPPRLVRPESPGRSPIFERLAAALGSRNQNRSGSLGTQVQTFQKFRICRFTNLIKISVQSGIKRDKAGSYERHTFTLTLFFGLKNTFLSTFLPRSNSLVSSGKALEIEKELWAHNQSNLSKYH